MALTAGDVSNDQIEKNSCPHRDTLVEGTNKKNIQYLRFVCVLQAEITKLNNLGLLL